MKKIKEAIKGILAEILFNRPFEIKIDDSFQQLSDTILSKQKMYKIKVKAKV